MAEPTADSGGVVDIDFDKEMVGTVEVDEKDRLDLNALTVWFTNNVEGFSGPINYQKFKGGQSNPTYRIETPKTLYVLRRQPFGKLLPSAHAVTVSTKCQACIQLVSQYLEHLAFVKIRVLLDLSSSS